MVPVNMFFKGCLVQVGVDVDEVFELVVIVDRFDDDKGE